MRIRPLSLFASIFAAIAGQSHRTAKSTAPGVPINPSRPQGKNPRESHRSPGPRLMRRLGRNDTQGSTPPALDTTRLRKHQLSDFLGELQAASFRAVRRGNLQHACDLAGTANRMHYKYFQRPSFRHMMQFPQQVVLAFASGRYSDNGR